MNICAEEVNILIQPIWCHIHCPDQHSSMLFLATLLTHLTDLLCMIIMQCACLVHVLHMQAFRDQLGEFLGKLAY